MKGALYILIALAICLPGLAWAGDAVGTSGKNLQISLLTASPKGTTVITPKKQIPIKAAAADTATLSLKPYLNTGKNISSGKAVFYTSPGQHLRIKPFHALGGSGVALQLRW